MNQILLGIDPGLAATGYGILEIRHGTLLHRDHGVIKTSPRQTTGQRLKVLYNSILELIEHYHPVAAGIEQLFFSKNVSSALPVAEARGVVLLCFEQVSIPAMDFTPLQIKQSIVGVGRATKEQVQEMVKFLLGVNEIPKPDHAADALAVAICLYHRRQWNDLSN